MQTMRMYPNTTNTANTANADNENKILYSELSYKIVGISYRIQNNLGRFCREAQYANAFEEGLKATNINYVKNKYLPVPVGDKSNIKNWADFIIENKIIVDLKAKPFVERNDYFQMQRYLRICNFKLGLIINFQNKYLKPKRVINSQYSQNL